METNYLQLDRETLFSARIVQCSGQRFVQYYATRLSKHAHDLSNASSESNISDDCSGFEVDVDYLKGLDPKEWKDQDHYAVLGLKQLR